jgi:hypothetical protein
MLCSRAEKELAFERYILASLNLNYRRIVCRQKVFVSDWTTENQKSGLY